MSMGGTRKRVGDRSDLRVFVADPARAARKQRYIRARSKTVQLEIAGAQRCVLRASNAILFFCCSSADLICSGLWRMPTFVLA